MNDEVVGFCIVHRNGISIRAATSPRRRKGANLVEDEPVCITAVDRAGHLRGGELSSLGIIRPHLGCSLDPPRRHDRSHGGGLPGGTPRGHRPDRREAARALLVGYPLTGQIGPASVLAVLKLILHPILAWVIAVPILGLGAPWAPVVVVIAGMPSGAMVYLFGARYQTASDVAAGTVVVASAASVVTLSILLVLLGL